MRFSESGVFCLSRLVFAHIVLEFCSSQIQPSRPILWNLPDSAIFPGCQIQAVASNCQNHEESPVQTAAPDSDARPESNISVRIRNGCPVQVCCARFNIKARFKSTCARFKARVRIKVGRWVNTNMAAQPAQAAQASPALAGPCTVAQAAWQRRSSPGRLGQADQQLVRDSSEAELMKLSRPSKQM